MDLNAAKDKVLECEKVLKDLQEEVKDSEVSLAFIGQANLTDLRQRILQAIICDSESVGGSVDDASGSLDRCS